jgi:hypothetical protein
MATAPLLRPIEPSTDCARCNAMLPRDAARPAGKNNIDLATPARSIGERRSSRKHSASEATFFNIKKDVGRRISLHR